MIGERREKMLKSGDKKKENKRNPPQTEMRKSKDNEAYGITCKRTFRVSEDSSSYVLWSEVRVSANCK